MKTQVRGELDGISIIYPIIFVERPPCFAIVLTTALRRPCLDVREDEFVYGRLGKVYGSGVDLRLQIVCLGEDGQHDFYSTLGVNLAFCIDTIAVNNAHQL